MDDPVRLRVRSTDGTFTGTRVETEDGRLVEGVSAMVIRLGPWHEHGLNVVTIDVEMNEIDLIGWAEFPSVGLSEGTA